MADDQLSTRDLATRPETDDADRSLETEQPTERTPGANHDGNRQPQFESAQADEPLTRDRAADHPEALGGVTQRESLLPDDQSERFTTRWQEIQTSFVDRPRDAVEEADTLVADLMQRLAASFSSERERLEAQWDRGDDVSTEDLRVALTRYRSFFDRLLSA
jgi:hypothetical protein